MTENDKETLPHDHDEQRPVETPPQPSRDDAGTATHTSTDSVATDVDRAFASEYLDELILAILLRRGELNGMEVIREFSRLFNIQFSPGTVYPHLHSLEGDGLLACRECVQTKEYSIDDSEAAQDRIDSALAQMSRLSTFLATTAPEE